MTSSIEQASTFMTGFLRFEPTIQDITAYALWMSMIVIFFFILLIISSGNDNGRHP